MPFYYWVVVVLHIFWVQVSYQYMILNYFFHSVGCLFTFLVVSFEAQRFFVCVCVLMKHNLIFILVTYTFGVIYKKPLLNPRSWRFTPMFSFTNFIVLTLTFKSMIYFELIFMYGIYSFTCEYPVFPATFVEKTIYSFPHWVILAPLLKISWP